MEELQLEKSQYSEWVVRNALYWLSARTEWTLDDSASAWHIHLVFSDDAIRSELHRLLNDYTLREQLSAQTRGYREAITKAVLQGITKRLTS